MPFKHPWLYLHSLLKQKLFPLHSFLYTLSFTLFPDQPFGESRLANRKIVAVHPGGKFLPVGKQLYAREGHGLLLLLLAKVK